ncbi:MAG TPA: hypothetical protein DCM33_07115 [Acinetobacter radioresistens]|nr:hypothetical protein [Acinetobacter radioresistens]
MTKHDNVSQGKIMKATEFVKRRGVSDARRILKDSEGCASVKLYGKYEFSTDDLKRLVESHELVERTGGLRECRLMSYRMNVGDRLAQAIADVEACQ